MNTINCTAATLRAILCFIDSGKTPKIAYDRDDLAQELIDKIRIAVNDSAGSESVSVMFGENQEELHRQFVGVMQNIGSVFASIIFVNGGRIA